MDIYDIVIIGAGPAGLMAASESAQTSKKVLVLEKMYKPALKLIISGKGRCNITNSAEKKDFLSHFGKNGRFLKFAFSEFFNTDLLNYFKKLGVSFKLERGGRYFPESDDAMEVAKALQNKVRSLSIPIILNSDVSNILCSEDKTFIISFRNKDQGSPLSKVKASRVILAVGGKSYPGTGSDGSGFKLASKLGHTITPVSPSLVPIDTKGGTARKLQGLSLKNVKASVWGDNKKMGEIFGEMLFTESGMSGPIILSLSKTVSELLRDKKKVHVSIDLKPAMDHNKVDERLLREIAKHNRQSFKGLLKTLLPKKLIPVFIEELKIPEDKKMNQLSALERKALRMLLKEFRFEVKGIRSFDQAIVTSGGVSIKEIDPKTMESKLVKGVYFAGEIIDVDADTGGFNLQAAFSTGWVAGRSAGRQ